MAWALEDAGPIRRRYGFWLPFTTQGARRFKFFAETRTSLESNGNPRLRLENAHIGVGRKQR